MTSALIVEPSNNDPRSDRFPGFRLSSPIGGCPFGLTFRRLSTPTTRLCSSRLVQRSFSPQVADDPAENDLPSFNRYLGSESGNSRIKTKASKTACLMSLSA